MGITCGRESTKPRKLNSGRTRDFQPANMGNFKSEEIDRAIAKDETTTSYQNITKVYSFKKELGILSYPFFPNLFQATATLVQFV